MRISSLHTASSAGSFGVRGTRAGASVAAADWVDPIDAAAGDRETGPSFAGAARSRREEAPSVEHSHYRGVPEVLAPLSSAQFITQHIAQEWMAPAEIVDFAAASKAYQRREIRDAGQKDLTRPA